MKSEREGGFLIHSHNIPTSEHAHRVCAFFLPFECVWCCSEFLRLQGQFRSPNDSHGGREPGSSAGAFNLLRLALRARDEIRVAVVVPLSRRAAVQQCPADGRRRWEAHSRCPRRRGRRGRARREPRDGRAPQLGSLGEAAAARRIRCRSPHRHRPQKDRHRPRRARRRHGQDHHQQPHRPGLFARESVVAAIREVPAGKPGIRNEVRHSRARGGRGLVRAGASDSAGSGEGVDRGQPSEPRSTEEAGVVDTGLEDRGAQEVWPQEGAEGPSILQALKHGLRLRLRLRATAIAVAVT